jgi:protein ImuB
MARIACLLLPDLATAAVVRTDPDLAGRPLALTEGRGPHASVVAASAEARARGVRPGRHSAAQARMILADLVLRARDVAAERTASLALADVAASCTERVEIAADGSVLLDADGCRALFGSETGLATALAARSERVGLAARTAVAATATTARLAALHGAGCTVVPAGTELGFLAPLPLACLAPDDATATTLARWGVRRLGDLARLPEAEVATRLGPSGAALVRAARGLDQRPLLPNHTRREVEESLSLDHPIDTLEPLLFVLRGLVERTIERLGLAGIGCVRMHLGLRLDDRSRDDRTLVLAAPTRDPKTLLALLRIDLEGRPPRAAIDGLTLTVVPHAIRPTQLGLFVPAGPAPERLATTLARLGVLCGVDRVGHPVAVDTHVPGTAAVAPFAPPAPASARSASDDCRLMVRTVRPPKLLEVFSTRDEPTYVRGHGMAGRVVGAAGPWRVTVEWWRERPCRRDYYDLELTDGGVYRCFRDLGTGRWYVDGVYD